MRPAVGISAKIRDLDGVNARWKADPGEVSLPFVPREISLWSDPRVQAVVSEGNAAIEPLLDCMEHDTRLTRSVSFSFDHATGRNFITVKDAAYTAILRDRRRNPFRDRRRSAHRRPTARLVEQEPRQGKPGTLDGRQGSLRPARLEGIIGEFPHDTLGAVRRAFAYG